MRRFAETRRAGAAIEFALIGLAVFGFLVIIINLGLLGLYIATLSRSVQATGRWAAVAATRSFASSSSGAITEPCLSTVVGVFNNYAAPPLPTLAVPTATTASGTQTTGNITLQTTWNGTAAGSPGIYVTLSATYIWLPFGFAEFTHVGLPIRIVTAATVMGSSLSGASVNAACS